MQITFTVTPGYQFAPNEKGDTDKFNLLGLPTLAGAVTFADGKSDVAVTPTTKTFATQDLTGDILRVVAGHGASTGQRVKVSSATTLPGGLSASYEYFLRPDTTNPSTDFTLHYTLAGAQNATDRVDVTSAGTGVHTLTYYAFATGHAFIYDTSGQTWEKGIVSPESLPEFVGATASTPGTRGAVPQPAPSERAKYLKGDGTFDDPTAGVSTPGNLFLYYATI
jgi:hypothetical protein